MRESWSSVSDWAQIETNVVWNDPSSKNEVNKTLFLLNPPPSLNLKTNLYCSFVKIFIVMTLFAHWTLILRPSQWRSSQLDLKKINTKDLDNQIFAKRAPIFDIFTDLFWYKIQVLRKFKQSRSSRLCTISWNPHNDNSGELKTDISVEYLTYIFTIT